MAEDLPFELCQEGAGLETELVLKHPPAPAVDLECFGLPAGPVERDHELSAELLAQGVVGDQRLQLRDELGVVAELQLRLDSLLDRRRGEAPPGGRSRVGGHSSYSNSSNGRPRHSESACSRVRTASSAGWSAASLVSRSNSAASGPAPRARSPGSSSGWCPGGEHVEAATRSPGAPFARSAAVALTTARRSAGQRRPARSRAPARARAAPADGRSPAAAPCGLLEPRGARGCGSLAHRRQTLPHGDLACKQGFTGRIPRLTAR